MSESEGFIPNIIVWPGMSILSFPRDGQAAAHKAALALAPCRLWEGPALAFGSHLAVTLLPNLHLMDVKWGLKF